MSRTRRPRKIVSSAQAELDTLRASAFGMVFRSPEWEALMVKVRALVTKIAAKAAPEPFYSVDSGFHPTMLPDGRIIAPGNP